MKELTYGFYNYLGKYGDTGLWKLGETTNPNKRVKDIRRSSKDKGIEQAEDFDYIMVRKIAISKTQSIMIESTTRAYMESKGYAIVGNDHIQTDRPSEEVVNDYADGVKMAVKMLKKMYGYIG